MGSFAEIVRNANAHSTGLASYRRLPIRMVFVSRYRFSFQVSITRISFQRISIARIAIGLCASSMSPTELFTRVRNVAGLTAESRRLLSHRRPLKMMETNDFSTSAICDCTAKPIRSISRAAVGRMTIVAANGAYFDTRRYRPSC
jgi:hypothetical protein